MMDICLTLNESRVVGCLLEKDSTTSDNYPLTLNALATACNQKSNRDPIMSLSDDEVRSALENLVSARLVSVGSGSRVSKYRHRFCNTEFSTLQLTPQQKAIVCCLLLRGAQTPGELRSRTARMANFANVKEVEEVLQRMMVQGWVRQLPRVLGKRELRYGHCFSGEHSLSEESGLPVKALR